MVLPMLKGWELQGAFHQGVGSWGAVLEFCLPHPPSEKHRFRKTESQLPRNFQCETNRDEGTSPVDVVCTY